MRVLLANKFHYPRGGDCIHAMDLARILAADGHEVAFFAMACPENQPSPWNSFFPSEVAFTPRKPWKMLKGLVRPVHAPDVSRRFHRLLDAFAPDVVHLHNVHTQLSPVLAQVAKERGRRVVWTLHDYKLLCPRYDCLRDGKPCELCFGDDKSHVLRYACMKNSRLASAVAYLEARKWNRAKLAAWTDAFICPSHFMKSKMMAGGFAPDQLHVIHNFIPAGKQAGARAAPGDHYAYVGRLSPEKGVQTLLLAASRLPYRLKVAGTGPLEKALKTRCAAFPQIEFLGHLDWPDLRELLATARFLVQPSECYENNPLSTIEALALGVPVLGARIGGIPELIEHEPGCRLFESGNPDDLARNLADLWNRPAPAGPGDAERFSARRYLQRLMPLYAGPS